MTLRHNGTDHNNSDNNFTIFSIKAHSTMLQSLTAFSIMLLSITPLNIMTLGITLNSRMRFSLMTLNIMALNRMAILHFCYSQCYILSMLYEMHDVECRQTESHGVFSPLLPSKQLKKVKASHKNIALLFGFPEQRLSTFSLATNKKF